MSTSSRRGGGVECLLLFFHCLPVNRAWNVVILINNIMIIMIIIIIIIITVHTVFARFCTDVTHARPVRATHPWRLV